MVIKLLEMIYKTHPWLTIRNGQHKDIKEETPYIVNKLAHIMPTEEEIPSAPKIFIVGLTQPEVAEEVHVPKKDPELALWPISLRSSRAIQLMMIVASARMKLINSVNYKWSKYHSYGHYVLVTSNVPGT